MTRSLQITPTETNIIYYDPKTFIVYYARSYYILTLCSKIIFYGLSRWSWNIGSVYKMNAPYILWSKSVHSIYGAFWGVLRWIHGLVTCSVPISQPMNLRLHSMSSYFPANGVNLRLHSHEFKFLFEVNGLKTQTAFPWVPIPLPMNLRMHSHEFLFPSQWISECIPMSSYSQPMNLRMHSHEFLFPSQIFGVFWLGTTHVRPSWFRNVYRESKKLHSDAILRVPLTITHGYP